MGDRDGVTGAGAGRVRVAIVDDQQMVLAGLQAWVGREAPDVEVVAAVTGWADLLADPALGAVDVVLLDLDLGDGVPVAVKIAVLRQSGTAVVVVSNLADPATVGSCLEAGAAGYLPKSHPATELLQAVRSAARGETWTSPALARLLVEHQRAGPAAAAGRPALSRQELNALTLYASGLKLASVARRLGITENTAKGYLDRVREKYAAVGRDARTKIDLRRRAVEDGLLDER